MKKIYKTPCTELYKVQITNHLLIGSDTKDIGVDTSGSDPVNLDENPGDALGRNNNEGNIWDNAW